MWGKWCECVLHGLGLSELTAHKGPVIPCVKDGYRQGPFNLTLSNSLLHLSFPTVTRIFIYPYVS